MNDRSERRGLRYSVYVEQKKAGTFDSVNDYHGKLIDVNHTKPLRSSAQQCKSVGRDS